LNKPTRCIFCLSKEVTKRGFDKDHKQAFYCKKCRKRFVDGVEVNKRTLINNQVWETHGSEKNLWKKKIVIQTEEMIDRYRQKDL